MSDTLGREDLTFSSSLQAIPHCVAPLAMRPGFHAYRKHYEPVATTHSKPCPENINSIHVTVPLHIELATHVVGICGPVFFYSELSMSNWI